VFRKIITSRAKIFFTQRRDLRHNSLGMTDANKIKVKVINVASCQSIRIISLYQIISYIFLFAKRKTVSQKRFPHCRIVIKSFARRNLKASSAERRTGRKCVRCTRWTREKEEREGWSHRRRKKSAGSQIAMKPGTDASRGFHITTGPPMVVLPVSFASSTDTHSSIDPDALANSCSKELCARKIDRHRRTNAGTNAHER